MIAPKLQWAQMIDCTNDCNRACSNCTRCLAHARKPFTMSVETFSQCVEALKDFPTESPPSEADPHKMVGLIGGEPMLCAQFETFAKIMAERIPNREHRGLWCGINWKATKHAKLIEDTFGYINHNMHNTLCKHSPVLVSIKDVVPDKTKHEALINDCWLQRLWSATCTPKGYFFCEVAGALDMLFDGPGGLPIEPGCWNRPISDFQYQIDFACHGHCGIPLNLPGRPDSEEIDDISPSNLAALPDSPRVKAGAYVLHTTMPTGKEAKPWKYLQ